MSVSCWYFPNDPVARDRMAADKYMYVSLQSLFFSSFLFSVWISGLESWIHHTPLFMAQYQHRFLDSFILSFCFVLFIHSLLVLFSKMCLLSSCVLNKWCELINVLCLVLFLILCPHHCVRSLSYSSVSFYAVASDYCIICGTQHFVSVFVEMYSISSCLQLLITTHTTTVYIFVHVFLCENSSGIHPPKALLAKGYA